MAEATISFTVDDELLTSFAAAAEAKQRAGEDLLRDYMEKVVRERQEAGDYDAWFRREVQKGIDSIAAGDVWSNEEVEAEFAMMRAELRREVDAAE